MSNSIGTVSTPVLVAPINVALQANGGTASASSTLTYPGISLPSLNDGDRKGTIHWMDSTQSAYPDWAQVNFSGGPQNINEINVFTLQDTYPILVGTTLGMTFTKYGITSFVVQYRDAFSNWVTVPGGTIVGNNKVWTKITFPSIATDSIRVQVNASVGGGFSRITEIEAFTGPAPLPQPTTVVMTSPTNDAVFAPAPATVPLTANLVAGLGWTTDRIEFFEGVNPVPVATASAPAPFTVNWTNVSAGIYTLTARAYDTLGATVDSAPVTVTVSNGINVAAQANGGTASASSTLSYPGISLPSLNDGDRKGTIHWMDSTQSAYPDWAQVNFSGGPQNINEINVFTLQDTYPILVAPTLGMTFTKYGITSFVVQYRDAFSNWVTVPAGTIVGNNKVWTKITFPSIATDSIRVQVNASVGGGFSRITEIEAFTGPAPLPQPTTVVMTSPTNDAVFAPAPATVPLTANLVAGLGWTTDRIEFFEGVNPVPVATASAPAPFTVNWTNVSAGIYTLTARAYDTLGATVDSAPVTVTVSNGINVAAQANGGTASASSTLSYPGISLPSLNDGDRKGTIHWMDSTQSAYPDWAQVNFSGGPQNINEINVFTLQDTYPILVAPTLGMTFTKYGITSFVVQYRDAFSNWVTVPGGTIVGNNKVWTKITFPSITTDSIRVQVNASVGSGFSRITEIEAYAQ